MDDRHALEALVRYTNWANHEMVVACAPLSHEQLERVTMGTYGTLGQILVHLARAQGGYTRRLVGWEPTPADELPEDDPFPGVARIDAHLAMTGAMLAEAIGSLDLGRRIEVGGDEGRYEVEAWVILLQMSTHATEHRQQIATALTALGVPRPEPDLWAYWLSTARG